MISFLYGQSPPSPEVSLPPSMLRRPRSQAPSLVSTLLENRIRMALEEKEKEEKMLMD